MAKATLTYAVKLYKPKGVTQEEVTQFLQVGLQLARDGAQRNLANEKTRGITIETVKLIKSETDYLAKGD